MLLRVCRALRLHIFVFTIHLKAAIVFRYAAVVVSVLRKLVRRRRRVPAQLRAKLVQSSCVIRKSRLVKHLGNRHTVFVIEIFLPLIIVSKPETGCKVILKQAVRDRGILFARLCRVVCCRRRSITLKLYLRLFVLPAVIFRAIFVKQPALRRDLVVHLRAALRYFAVDLHPVPDARRIRALDLLRRHVELPLKRFDLLFDLADPFLNVRGCKLNVPVVRKPGSVSLLYRLARPIGFLICGKKLVIVLDSCPRPAKRLTTRSIPSQNMSLLPKLRQLCGSRLPLLRRSLTNNIIRAGAVTVHTVFFKIRKRRILRARLHHIHVSPRVCRALHPLPVHRFNVRKRFLKRGRRRVPYGAAGAAYDVTVFAYSQGGSTGGSSESLAL